MQTASPLIRQTPPEALALKVEAAVNPRQFTISNDYTRLEDFDVEYVCFGGYFGEHNPNTFAAAPDLLEVAQTLLAFTKGTIQRVGLTDANGIVAAAEAAIAKAEGR